MYVVIVNGTIKYTSTDRNAIANYVYTLLMDGVTDIRIREED